jgi:hypothetical protein
VDDLVTRIKKNYDLDLGNGYYLKFFSWSPDRKLNPQYKGIFSVEKIGAHICCPHGNAGGIMFKQTDPRYAEIFPSNESWWDLISLEPLHVEPSIQFLNPSCCHGYIREGKWVNA